MQPGSDFPGGGDAFAEAVQDAVATFADLVALTQVFGESAARPDIPRGMRTFVIPSPAPFGARARTLVEECLDAPRVLPYVTSSLAPLHLAPRRAEDEVDLAYHGGFEDGSLASVADTFVITSTIVDAMRAVAHALEWGATNGLRHRALSPSLVGLSPRGWCVTGLGLVDGFERTRWLAHQEHRALLHGVSLEDRHAAVLLSDPFLSRTAGNAAPDDRVGFARLLAWLVLRDVEADGQCRARLAWSDHVRQNAAELSARFAEETSPFLPRGSLRRLADITIGAPASTSLSSVGDELATMLARSPDVDPPSFLDWDLEGP